MTHDDSFAQNAGHPPSAAKTVCVDLDSTIIPWGALEEVRAPFPGVVEAMQRLRDEGYRIVILTSRMSPTWWQAEADARGVDVNQFAIQQILIVDDILTKGGIPFDNVTSEKVPALAYFDDKGIRVTDRYGLAYCIDDFLFEAAS